MDVEPRPVSATYVESTHLVLPGETNAHGTAFGGQVCAWLDLACSVAAMRHARAPVVTVSMDELVFHAPIRLGHIAIVRAHVNAVFRTSVEVGAEVFSEHPLTGERHHTTTAYLTFVSLDEAGKPRPMAPLRCETDEERRRERQAHERRARRLAARAAEARGEAPAADRTAEPPARGEPAPPKAEERAGGAAAAAEVPDAPGYRLEIGGVFVGVFADVKPASGPEAQAAVSEPHRGIIVSDGLIARGMAKPLMRLLAASKPVTGTLCRTAGGARECWDLSGIVAVRIFDTPEGGQALFVTLDEMRKREG